MARTKHVPRRNAAEQSKKTLQFGRSPLRTPGPSGSRWPQAMKKRKPHCWQKGTAALLKGIKKNQKSTGIKTNQKSTGIKKNQKSTGIKKNQKSTELSFAPFVRLVREISNFYGRGHVSRWTPGALLTLQEAAEYYMSDLFKVPYLRAIQAKRVTLSGVGYLPSTSAASSSSTETLKPPATEAANGAVKCQGGRLHAEGDRELKAQAGGAKQELWWGNEAVKPCRAKKLNSRYYGPAWVTK